MLCMVGLFMRRQCVARRVAAGPFGARVLEEGWDFLQEGREGEEGKRRRILFPTGKRSGRRCRGRGLKIQ